MPVVSVRLISFCIFWFLGNPSVVLSFIQMNGFPATKIQAVARGYLVRMSNFGAAVKALNWLKEYKLLDELQAKKKKNVHDFNEDTFFEALQAINEAQQQLHASATKIQALGRGYIVRKFDMRKMMSVVAEGKASEGKAVTAVPAAYPFLIPIAHGGGSGTFCAISSNRISLPSQSTNGANLGSRAKKKTEPCPQS